MIYEENLTPEQIIEHNRISTAICEEVVKVEAKYKSNDDFYHSREWKRARDMARVRDEETDAWAYLKEGIIQPGNVVHHIISISERPDLRCALSNLITVSAVSHREIEKIYNKGDKAKIQAILQAEVDRRMALLMPQPQPQTQLPVDEGLGEGESLV